MKVWNDQVWSKVIANLIYSLIITVCLWVWHEFSASTFNRILSSTLPVWIALFLVCMLLTTVLHYYRSKKEVVVWKTRKQWWDKELPKIVERSEKLVVIDSYQGSKHEFWALLGKRIDDDAPFNFLMLDLKENDNMFEHCIQTAVVPKEVINIDRAIDFQKLNFQRFLLKPLKTGAVPFSAWKLFI